MIPSRKDILLIAAEASVDPRTVRTVYDNKPTRELTLARIVAAARKLKLPAPPIPKGGGRDA